MEFYKLVMLIQFSCAAKGVPLPAAGLVRHLPYLVEFDNFGSHNLESQVSRRISGGWIDHVVRLDARGRTQPMLHYAWDWVRKTDPNGHLGNAGSRVLSPGNREDPHWLLGQHA